MHPVLVIFNPRQIADCLDAFSVLDIEKAYLTGYTERQLVDVMAEFVNTTNYSHYMVISDDGIVRQRAVDAVLELVPDHPVVTGWSNLDGKDARVNLTYSPLTSPVPSPQAYDMYFWSEIVGHPDAAVPTNFAGMCLTTMSRELWLRFPFGCYHGCNAEDAGCASDYHLSLRLQVNNIPIVAAREGFVFHVKDLWNTLDQGFDKRLRIGEDVGVTVVPR
jgi:hypothetical protein